MVFEHCWEVLRKRLFAFFEPRQIGNFHVLPIAEILFTEYHVSALDVEAYEQGLIALADT